MNTEKILAVADAIETHAIKELGFNMRYMMEHLMNADKSGHGCRTVGCIAGWTVAVEHGMKYTIDVDIDYMSAAAGDILELDHVAADNLFYPPNVDGSRNGFDATPLQAATVLRNLAATGKVDWGKALS